MIPDKALKPELNVWWRLMRPHTLTAAVMPVLIGTAMAYAEGKVALLLFAAMLVASLLIQSAVNMFNEYFDYRRGLDTKASVGIGGVIVSNELKEKTVLTTAISFFSVSILLGVYICLQTSWWIAVIGSLSMAIGYFYSGGPHPLAYTPLGELAAGIFMGVVIVLISYFVQTGTLTFSSILLSVPISILVGAILLANNIRDSEGDERKGRRTLAVRWGHSKAVQYLGNMFAACFIWTVGLVLFKLVTPWILIVFVSTPKATQSIRKFQIGRTPSEMMPAMKATSALHSQFGLLFSIGLLAGKFFAFK